LRHLEELLSSNRFASLEICDDAGTSLTVTRDSKLTPTRLDRHSSDYAAELLALLA
jgi:hypothetical protein